MQHTGPRRSIPHPAISAPICYLKKAQSCPRIWRTKNVLLFLLFLIGAENESKNSPLDTGVSEKRNYAKKCRVEIQRKFTNGGKI